MQRDDYKIIREFFAEVPVSELANRMEYEIVGKHDSGDVMRAILVLGCGKACQIPLRQGEAKSWDGVHVWGWDGKEEQPTVTPSIACTKCGFHKTLIKGEWQ